MRPSVRSRLTASLAIVLLTLAACGPQQAAPPAAEDSKPAVKLVPVTFDVLPGWREDDPAGALAAFRVSCRRLEQIAPEKSIGRVAAYGTGEAWSAACTQAKIAADDPASARTFFETAFRPYAITDAGKPEGLLTGYYEPLLVGSRVKEGRYRYPLHARPADLISVDLGQFDPDLAGKQVSGRVRDGSLVPYATRAEIDRGDLDGEGLELFWVTDPVAKFMLQIQGSGIIELPDGTRQRVGYAAQNGRPYRAIGRDLIAQGELAQDEVSLQSIRDWLAANPRQAQAMMEKNPSYVFFVARPDASADAGPIGAQSVPLTPGRSLAVDRRYVPLGVPVWLDATAPFPDGEKPLRRLVVAQDTGGAIRGVVRGDLFWGSGEYAEHVAGHMKSPARLYVLLPVGTVPTS